MTRPAAAAAEAARAAAADKVAMRPVQFPATDGVPLSGRWFLPRDGAADPPVPVVVVPGGGIPARYYRGMAAHLAGCGASVLTFDYRGIGESRRGSLKGLQAGIDDWGCSDLGGALAHARTEFPGVAPRAVTHSIGAILLGAPPEAQGIDRVVLLAPHTAYWRDYGGRWRWLLYLTWHQLMPTVTRLVGYFPAKALGLGEDLPRAFALDWARRRQPDLMPTEHERRRFGAILARFDRMTAQALAISVADDAFAPPAAARRLLALYPNMPVVQETVTPADLHRKRLGHMAFMRRSTGPYFWDRIAAWFLRTTPTGRASAGTRSDVPPSGTKGPAPAGSATLFRP